MKQLALIAPALTLMLAACGSETTQPPAAPASAEVVTADTEGTPGDVAPAAPSAATLTAIPAAFHGAWDVESGTCEPASDMRLEIGARTIGFYESEGKVITVTPQSDGSAAVELAMTGEGESWNMGVVLSVRGDGDGRRLIVRDSGVVETEARTLKPCPA